MSFKSNKVCTVYVVTYWAPNVSKRGKWETLSSGGKEEVSPGQYSSHLEILTCRPRGGPNSCIRVKVLDIED